MRSSGSASSSISAVPARRPTRSSRRWRAVSRGAFELGERREHQRRRRRADAEDEREQLGRPPSTRRSPPSRARSPTTITSVEKTIFCAMCTRKFDELKIVSARSRARLTKRRAIRSSGSSRRSQASGSASRRTVVAERQRAEQHEPAAARQQQHDEQRVEDGRDEVREVLHVPALPRDEQVVEQAEREAHGERDDDEQRRDAGVPDQPCGALATLGTIQASARPSGSVTAPITAYIARPVDATSLMSSGRRPAVRLGREAHDRRPDAEVEHREVDRHGADDRPDAERRLADRVDDDRRDDEPGDDRGRVDRVDAERVPPQEAHYSDGDDVEVRDQRSRNRAAQSGAPGVERGAGGVQEPDRRPRKDAFAAARSRRTCRAAWRAPTRCPPPARRSSDDQSAFCSNTRRSPSCVQRQ